MFKPFLFSGCMLFAAHAVAAAGPKHDNITEISAIRDIASGFGFAKIKPMDKETVIEVRHEGTKYLVLPYGCDAAGKACENLQFFAGWSDFDIGLEEVNAWNQGYRFAKAYIDNDGDIILEMDISIEYSVGSAYLEDTFETWLNVIELFEDKVLRPDAMRPVEPRNTGSKGISTP